MISSHFLLGLCEACTHCNSEMAGFESELKLIFVKCSFIACHVTVTRNCNCGKTCLYVDQKVSATKLDVKRSVGVAQEVNLMSQLYTQAKVLPRFSSPGHTLLEVQNWTDVLHNLKK